MSRHALTVKEGRFVRPSLLMNASNSDKRLMRFTSVLFLLLLVSGNARGKDPITVYLAGDSTMAQKLAENRLG
jgi:hypothetical protein